jgi:hypothetical protein
MKTILRKRVVNVENASIEELLTDRNARAYVQREVVEEKKSTLQRIAERRAIRHNVDVSTIRLDKSNKVKRAKSDKHSCVKFIESLISQARYTQKEVVALTCQAFNDLAVITVRTYITDSKNERYFRVHKFDALTLTNARNILHY